LSNFYAIGKGEIVTKLEDWEAKLNENDTYCQVCNAYTKIMSVVVSHTHSRYYDMYVYIYM